jgi:hypothetical protein
MKTPASRAWEFKRGFIAPEIFLARSKEQARFHMEQAIDLDADYFCNHTVGFCLTALAEDTAEELELYETETQEIPEWVFELASQVAEDMGVLDD